MNQTLPLKRGDLRDALLAYARRAADAGEIATMSLRAAARDLGVSSGAVYRHFDDRDQLLKAVVQQGFDEMRALFVAIRPEAGTAPSAVEAVARAFRMGRAFVDFAEANPTLWRMMFGRIGCLCREDKMGNPDAMRYTILDCVRENCLDIHRRGGLPGQPDMDDIRFMWSAIHGAADLMQSGARLDVVSRTEVADQTTLRSLRAMGCPEPVLTEGRALLR
ncbi:TetR/AcrR family transcriptional regulator [Halovulum dunhuangense]|uniref:TetR/AcrR family transcriptional regulator n=1 Tax=Halovulum dunhuangense TaxID=1505036 RepID=A0A849KR72_9RHOB|nr:TetR/AcrR family transcriptional regulator [Halovulum dunhuangense]NNU79573.1 TetR/AcrR family transcriptional regulator [Halovulum dunhuangense]